MNKHKPYKGEREFKNCIIGQSIIHDGVLYTTFYTPKSENWWSSDYYCFVLMARINMRDSDVKNMVNNGTAENMVGNMLDIHIDNVINRSSIGTTYERIHIAPSKDTSDGAILPCRKGCIIFDAFSVDIKSLSGKFGIFETESEDLTLSNPVRDITLTCVKLAATCNAPRLSEPIANCKLKVIDGTSQFLAITGLMKEPVEKPVTQLTSDMPKNEHYVQITANNSVNDISSIIKELHVSYGLYGTKYDNVQMTLHITNPHTMDHKSVSFTVNKRDILIVDKHELSFDETVCKLITLLNINTLNRNVIDKLEINKVGAFTITFENGEYIDINGAKECRLVDGWNNY